MEADVAGGNSMCRVRVSTLLAARPWNFFGCLDASWGGSCTQPRTTSALVSNLTMAAVSQKNLQLALALPSRLRTFFARYPPTTILPAGADPETAKTGYQKDTPNPFASTKHPITGKWHDPKYSLRRQAELVKLARQHHVEELLPFTVKGTEERLRKRVELGLRVKGTGVGQKVKGHKNERQLVSKYIHSAIEALGMRQPMPLLLTCWSRMEKRRKAMLEMPELIREWKKVGHAFSNILDFLFRQVSDNVNLRLESGTGKGSPSQHHNRLERACPGHVMFRVYYQQCTTTSQERPSLVGNIRCNLAMVRPLGTTSVCLMAFLGFPSG